MFKYLLNGFINPILFCYFLAINYSREDYTKKC